MVRQLFRRRLDRATTRSRARPASLLAARLVPLERNLLCRDKDIFNRYVQSLGTGGTPFEDSGRATRAARCWEHSLPIPLVGCPPENTSPVVTNVCAVPVTLKPGRHVEASSDGTRFLSQETGAVGDHQELLQPSVR